MASTSIGYEFITIDQFEQIMGNKPNWKRIQAKIRDGTKYHTLPIEDNTCITDLHHRLLKGNHKSESGEHITILATKLEKQVGKGWCILILPKHALDIPNLEIAPLGLSYQSRINERREITEKYRVTHDLSLPGIAS